jgi:hypothetical protein
MALTSGNSGARAMSETGAGKADAESLRGRGRVAQTARGQEDVHHWEEVGFAFCVALNRMKLEKAGFSMADEGRDGRSDRR